MHRRVWDHHGAVVDLGCASWDWSQRFLGKKRVLGADPFEGLTPQGAELWKGAVGAASGTARLIRNGHASSSRGAGLETGESVPVMTLAEILARWNLPEVSVLKLNVEGPEVDILMTLPERIFPTIDQIAVSFHDFLHGDHRRTEAVLGYLRNWYDVVSIDPRYSWYLCLKR